VSATAIDSAARSPLLAAKHTPSVGPIGRLGRYTATHFRTVLVGWLLVAVVLGFFAPRVEKALSGAGWEASGSQSVQARKLVERDFAGLGSYGLMTVVYSPTQTVASPAFRATIARVEQTLRVRTRPSGPFSRRPTGCRSPATATPRSCRPAPREPESRWSLRPTASRARCTSSPRRGGREPDRRGRDVVRLQRGQPLAMLKSEVISWPVTLGIMLLAFGSLVAAGLPLMLTMVGLMAAAGLALPRHADRADLDLGDELRADVRAGARHRLRAVHRYALPRRFLRLETRRPGGDAVTMDTAGKAVLFSGVTVLISLTAVMLVPSPAFRSMSLGIMLAVIFVLAATLTLLPAVLASSGRRSTSSRCRGSAQRRAPLPALRRVGRATLAPPVLRYGRPRAGGAARARLPGHAAEDLDAVDQGRPDRRLLARRLQPGPGGDGPGGDRTAADRRPGRRSAAVAQMAKSDPGIAQVMPTSRRRRARACHGHPSPGPLNPAVGRTIDRLSAASCPRVRCSAARSPKTTTCRACSPPRPRS
jgi:RND superfamily putative drug exporter